MRCLFVSHFIVVWLLLSQLPRQIPGQDTGHLIKVCGREFVRLQISTCGSANFGKILTKQNLRLAAGPFAEIIPSSINKDAETLNMMLEFTPNMEPALKATLYERQPSLRELQQPALKDSNLNFEELKKIIFNKQSDAEYNNLLELKNLGLDKQPRRESLFRMSLSEKCCTVGCTKRELARNC